MNLLLLLEDNADRIAAFQSAASSLGGEWQVCSWRDAPTMIAECEEYFDRAAFISLNHDLNPQPGVSHDPGTGLEVARFLASHWPVCPVLIHSSNTDRAWSMHNELRFAGWPVDRIGPIGEDWVSKLWLSKVREMLATAPARSAFKKPPDHTARLKRAFTSLEGLAIGDAVGEMLAYRHAAAKRIIHDGLPAGPWFHTDDTEMAISVAEVLKIYGYIHQDALARRFAWRFGCDPDRGYGSMTRKQLREIIEGADWRKTAADAFSGQGSMGNGGAMRVAPLGAYFADDLVRAAEEARASAVVTHTHPEGVAGTIAVAAAAAAAWQLRDLTGTVRSARLFETVLRFTPDSKVRRGLVAASALPPDADPVAVGRVLGNGSLVTAPDTVPFAIWCAAHHLDDYVEAMAVTISAGGDCDTNAAIVSGIVVMAAGKDAIPIDWRQCREVLPLEV